MVSKVDWFPIEQNPTRDGNYLVYVYGYWGPFVSIEWYDVDTGWGATEISHTMGITHWANLPAGPREEK